MKGTEKLTKFMQLGRVYRREELARVSKTLDRDLKTLMDNKKVLRAHRGIYYRPRMNVIGFTPPEEKDMVRAFLKTRDFLITSYNNFTNLGMGLTQMHNCNIVYNHKRSGRLLLGHRHYEFRIVPAYPKKLTLEYLMVDCLNHVRELPDDTSRVVRNLPANMHRFDRGKLAVDLERYGNFHATRILEPLLRGSAEKPEGGKS